MAFKCVWRSLEWLLFLQKKIMVTEKLFKKSQSQVSTFWNAVCVTSVNTLQRTVSSGSFKSSWTRCHVHLVNYDLCVLFTICGFSPCLSFFFSKCYEQCFLITKSPQLTTSATRHSVFPQDYILKRFHLKIINSFYSSYLRWAHRLTHRIIMIIIQLLHYNKCCSEHLNYKTV